MSSLIQRLHQDHKHITRLMDILDAQLGLFHSGQAPDYNLMLDIMHYMMTYPNIAHHNVEESLFEKLLTTNKRWKKQAKEITDQHLELAGKALAFTNDLEAIVDDQSIMPRDQIEQEARYYISLLREHLRQEEADLIPAAKRELSDEDFQEIEDSMPHMEDPMGSEQLLKEYETLYRYITNSD